MDLIFEYRNVVYMSNKKFVLPAGLLEYLKEKTRTLIARRAALFFSANVSREKCLSLSAWVCGYFHINVRDYLLTFLK